MNITILDNATLANTSLDGISALGDLTVHQLTSPEQVLAHSQNAEVLITNKVVINRDTMTQLKSLKLICVSATGTNNVDLDAAKDLDIAVTNVAGYSTPSVVQHTFSLITNLLGNTHRYQADCQQGAWQKSDMFCRLDYSFNDIQGKTLAIIGGGTLGNAVSKVAEAFGAEVIVAERKGAACRDGRTPFEIAIKTADIISVHCPLNDETRPQVELNKSSIQAVERLSAGHWVELTVDGSNSRCKLAARISSSGKFIFVNRSGVKMAEFFTEDLAAEYQLGRLKILDDEALFDRALESVISNLRSMKSEF